MDGPAVRGWFLIETDTIICGDAMEKLDELPPESVHAVVTDPPYFLGDGFMGREWDSFSDERAYQEWCQRWAEKCLRVLKPGGHLLAFGGNTRHHRLFTGVEDAGFEVRDTLTWHYGSGFPKALDVGKAIDKKIIETQLFDEVRDFLQEQLEESDLSINDVNDELGLATTGSGMAGHWFANESQQTLPSKEHWRRLKNLFGWDDCELDRIYDSVKDGAERPKVGDIENPASSIYGTDMDGEMAVRTKAATKESEKWDGWKTALKPATEFVVMARKPMNRTVAETVMEYGTGALNVDACRLEPGEGGDRQGEASAENRYRGNGATDLSAKPGARGGSANGRYPANLLLDEEAARMLDAQTGVLSSGKLKPGHDTPSTPAKNTYGEYDRTVTEETYGDSGGASRFFYCSKASKGERTKNGKIDNRHPTVKPLDVMKWLVKLVTAENQIVLDPFAGSGTTLLAARDTGRHYFGIEMQQKWVDVARARLGKRPENPEELVKDESQRSLASLTEEDGGKR